MGDKRGFTLIELLAVLIILSVIVAIAIPIFASKGDEAKIIAHNENVMILNKQAQAYLLAQDTIVDSEDILANMISEGYVKERPKNPIYPTDVTAQYKIKVSKARKMAKVYTKTVSELNIGDTIIFHGEGWKIITPTTGLIIKPTNVIDMKMDADNTQFFDPEDNNNVGYYLNNVYYNTFTQKEKALIKNSDWDIKNQGNVTISTVTANIGLINKTEYEFGRNIGIFPAKGDNTTWFFINVLENGVLPPLIDYIYYAGLKGAITSGPSENLHGVRPALKLIETTPLIEVDKGVYNIVEM